MSHWNTGRKATEEMRQKMRAAWTPERRAAQAARARSIPKEAAVKGAYAGIVAWTRDPANREVKSKMAAKQWTIEARRDAGIRTQQGYASGAR